MLPVEIKRPRLDGAEEDGAPVADPSAAMRALVDGLPTVHVLAVLRLKNHRDPVHPWEQHELSDLIAAHSIDEA